MDKTIELVNSVKDIQAMPSVIVKVLNAICTFIFILISWHS